MIQARCRAPVIYPRTSASANIEHTHTVFAIIILYYLYQNDVRVSATYACVWRRECETLMLTEHSTNQHLYRLDEESKLHGQLQKNGFEPAGCEAGRRQSSEQWLTNL